jgi:hypothetical protein
MFSFFNALSNKSGRNFDYRTSIKCTLGDFLNLSFPTRMKVLRLSIFGFDAWIDIDRMILQNNFKIFHLDKDVKLSFP